MKTSVMFKFWLCLIMTGVLFMTSGVLLAQETKNSQLNAKVSFDADDASLSSVLTSLSKLSGTNIVLAYDVQGDTNKKDERRVTIHIKDVSIETAIALVSKSTGLAYRVIGDNTILVGNKQRIMEESGERTYIVPMKKFNAEDLVRSFASLPGKTIALPEQNALMFIGNPDNYAVFTKALADIEKLETTGSQNYVIKLNYLNAATIDKSMQFIPGKYELIAAQNTIIFTGTPENYAKLMKIINEIDQVPYQFDAPYVIKLTYANAEAISKIIACFSGKSVIVEGQNTIVYIGTQDNYNMISKIVKDFDQAAYVNEMPYVIKIKYAKSDQLSSILQLLNMKVSFISGQNILLFMGKPDDYNKVLKIIEDIDQPSFLTNTPYLIKLTHANASNIAKTLQSFPGTIVTFEGQNALLYIGNQDNYKQLSKIIEEIDQPTYLSANPYLINLKYMNVAQLSKAIEAVPGKAILLNELNSLFFYGTPTEYETVRKMISDLDQSQNKGLKVNIITLKNVAPDKIMKAMNLFPGKAEIIEGTKIVLFLGTDDDYQQCLKLITEIDVPQKPDDNAYIITLTQGTADQIAKALQIMPGKTAAIEGQEALLYIGNKQQYENMLNIVKAMDIPQKHDELVSVFQLNNINADALSKSLQGSNVKTNPVEGMNAIVVYGTQYNINQVQKMISQLDIPQKQIEIRVRLIEIHLTQAKKFGIDWSKLNHLTTIIAEDPSNSSGTGLPYNYTDETGYLPHGDPTDFETLPAQQYFQKINGFDDVGHFSRQLTAFDITLDWLLENNAAKLLTDTRVTASNNHEAEIHIGEVIPYTAKNTQNEFEVNREQVGIMLKVTPSVNQDGQITATINPEVSSVVDFVAGYLPRTKVRRVSSTITVPDGKKIIVGGLLNSSITQRTDKVPLLGDLPFIGKIFQHRNETIENTDLIIEITPTLVGFDKEYLPPIVDKRLTTPLIEFGK